MNTEIGFHETSTTCHITDLGIDEDIFKVQVLLRPSLCVILLSN